MAAFHRVNYRCRGETTDQNLPCAAVHVARGGTDLFIGVGSQILHKEIQGPGVTLEHAEQLECTVGRLDLRLRGCGRDRFRQRSGVNQAEGRGEILRELTRKQKSKEGLKSGYDTVQRVDSKVSG